MHKALRIMLPDLQIHDFRINFSTNVFSVVVKLCKELGKRSEGHFILTEDVTSEIVEGCDDIRFVKVYAHDFIQISKMKFQCLQ